MTAHVPPDMYLEDDEGIRAAIARATDIEPGHLGHIVLLIEVTGDNGGWDTVACCQAMTDHLPECLMSLGLQTEMRARRLQN